jgi:hypothetical protein
MNTRIQLKKSSDRGDKIVTLTRNGTDIGSVTFKVYTEFVHIKEMEISPEFQGDKYLTHLLRYLNHVIRKNDLFGYSYNFALTEKPRSESATTDWAEKMGWKEMDTSGSWLYFDPKGELSPKDVGRKTHYVFGW